MIRENQRRFGFDWVIILIYILLVGFGYLNIMSASQSGEINSYFDMTQSYGKQIVFIGVSLIFIILTLSVDAKFYSRFSSIIYIGALLALVGLFLFGKEINGARSWYSIGSMTLQPSEFAKFATALAVAKYISDIQTNLKTIRDQLKAVAIIVVPAFLILLQNDAGSTLVYGAFFFVFYREGIQQVYVLLAFSLVLVAVLSLKFGVNITALIATVIIFGFYFLRRKKRASLLQPIVILLICTVFAYGVKLFYNHG